MKIEKFNDSSKKIKLAFVIGVILTALLFILVNIFLSKAKYQNTQSVKIVEGKVNYIVPDLNVMAVYLKNDKEYVTSKDIPQSGYVLSNDSYCTVPDSEDQIKEDITYRDGKVYIGINKKGTKCYLYFNSLADVTLAKLKQESKGTKESFDGIADTNEGIYSAPDGMYGGISYYYRGSVENNYVHFAGFMWRIIRINGDGTLRLIYDGDQAYDNGVSNAKRQIGTKAYNTDNSARKFVGFKYDSGEHGTTTASTILGTASDTSTLYGWYKANIVDKGFDSKVDQNGLFCNDRNATTNSSQTWDDWKKTKTDSTGSSTYYGAYMRFAGKSTATPTLSCENADDIFSKTGSTKGNESLTYPVGLITADEVVFAGGWYGTGNSSYYLYTGNYFWTMSPYYFGNGHAYVFYVDSNGSLSNHNYVDNARGVRPVINLKADTTFSGNGNGSLGNPYELIDGQF